MARYSKAIYELTAEAIAAAEYHVDPTRHVGVPVTVTASQAIAFIRGYLAGAYKQDNPKFDRARFDAASKKPER